MKKPRIRISGNHINELSENIPSNIFALNELIKNSYDACASYCNILIDPDSNQLTIRDDGSGLSEKSIYELFHLSRSTKKFGKVRSCGENSRRTQGSKGLGFLAAFRFGDQVTWDTSNNGKRYVFSVDKGKLTQLSDIAEHHVDVETHDSSGVGTKITITSDEKIIAGLLEYFAEDANNLKLVGAFADNNFEIELSLPERTTKTNEIPQLKNVNHRDQLFYVTYDSQTSDLLFYRKGYLEKRVTKKINSKKYDISLELMIYSLESHGRKKITPYFAKPDDLSITPLTFINDNLFNNYALFDSDILRSSRSASALPQVIGYVRVYSDSDDFQFNSDRTNFVENETTNQLRLDLREINELIQTTGSQLKASAKKTEKNITGPAYPKGGAGDHRFPLVRAKIELTKKEWEITIPSPQIDLLDYVESVTDSNGGSVSVSQLEIQIDGNITTNNILGSVTTQCEREVHFRFKDPNTGIEVNKLKLYFREKTASISGSDESKSLFFLPGSDSNYQISISHVATLMNQISEAHRHNPRYTHLVACSLRTIFELSTGAIESAHPVIFTHTFESGAPGQKTANHIVQLVHFLEHNNKIKTELAKALSMSYNSLCNLLDKEEFRKWYEKSNLGAHSGEKHLTTSDIENIAKIAGYYAAFCDALISKVAGGKFSNPEIAKI